MITREIKPVFTTSDKVEHTSLEAARRHDLERMVAQKMPGANVAHDAVVAFVLSNQEALVDLLTTTPTSRPSARKINRKPRAKKSTTPASVEDALKYQAGLANTQEPQPA